MNFLEKLHEEGLLSNESIGKIKERPVSPLFSVHWELRTILYLGVLLLTTGLGILVYRNIDSFNHHVVLIFLILVCGGGFFYCTKNKLPFSDKKVPSPDIFFDYILLLSCLTFITVIGYWQFKFNAFGNSYGLATFVPMIVLFFAAYFFDHLGVLSLAITNLAAWAGIAITPNRILTDNNFDNGTLIITGIALGIFLLLAGIATEKKQFKPHFATVYINFGIHLLFISCLAGLFHFHQIYIWLPVLMLICFYFYHEATIRPSFYFLLISVMYGYIGISYAVLYFLDYISFDMGALYLGFLYFIGSAIGLAFFLIRMNKKLKKQ